MTLACRRGAASGSRVDRGRRFRAAPDAADATTSRGAEKRRHARSSLCECVKLNFSGLRGFASIYTMKMNKCESKVEDRRSELNKVTFPEFDSKYFQRLQQVVCLYHRPFVDSNSKKLNVSLKTFTSREDVGPGSRQKTRGL